MPKGRQVWLEYNNEHWNYNGYLPSYMATAGALCLWNNTALNADAAYALRVSQMRDMFVEVFNETDINGNTNRGGEVKLIYATAGGQTGVTANMVALANSYNPPIAFDALALTGYVGNVSDVTTPTVAASVPTPTGSGGNLPAGAYYSTTHGSMASAASRRASGRARRRSPTRRARFPS